MNVRENIPAVQVKGKHNSCWRLGRDQYLVLMSRLRLDYWKRKGGICKESNTLTDGENLKAIGQRRPSLWFRPGLNKIA